MPAQPVKFEGFTLDARRDTIDFRDLMFTPTLIEVPPRKDIALYMEKNMPVLNQKSEGACSGFGLAAVVHYLMQTRSVDQDVTCVSPRMLYEMARRYDEWPGEDYSGSSARGAMKGWHKHGVCSEKLWVYKPGGKDHVLTNTRALDARNRPLGAYFRVNHKDLVAMHTAITEVGILYATASVHDGWGKVSKTTGEIPYGPESKVQGGHAFAIVAYDREGLWIQNSWDSGWGKSGYARISYDDWLANSMDVWVARLGVPVKRLSEQAAAVNRSPGTQRSQSYSSVDLRPHVISLGNDGKLREGGNFSTTKADVERIFQNDIPRITKDWDTVRIFLYAHGGLVGEAGFLQRLAEYRSAMLKENVLIYPLAFVWHTDLWSTVTNILKEAAQQRRPEGFLDDALDFMMDRLDDTLEVVVRGLKIKGLWDEMKENAWRATMKKDGGARLVADQLAKLMDKRGNVEVHIAGHSAGSIFHAPLVRYLTSKGAIQGDGWERAVGLDKPVSSLTLWAPGISLSDFRSTYLPALRSKAIKRFALYTLTEDAERGDHCANIYHKSLLYMVSNALEETYEEPILGMEKFVSGDKDLKAIFSKKGARWVKTPDNTSVPGASQAAHHGDFDDDWPTLMSTLADILPVVPKENVFEFGRSTSSLSARRRQLG